eukprot:sb/3472337/
MSFSWFPLANKWATVRRERTREIPVLTRNIKTDRVYSTFVSLVFTITDCKAIDYSYLLSPPPMGAKLINIAAQDNQTKFTPTNVHVMIETIFSCDMTHSGNLILMYLTKFVRYIKIRFPLWVISFNDMAHVIAIEENPRTYVKRQTPCLARVVSTINIGSRIGFIRL